MSIEFIAEVSSNHHQDINRCLAFIDEATRIGCDAIKFQLFKIEELFAPEILLKSEDHRKRTAWELPTEYIPLIAERCRSNKIKFGCTPFYLDAVNELLPFVDFYKISSYELLWTDLLIACAKTDKPLIISTGMANEDEVDAAVETILAANCRELTVLHCVSGYPTATEECNLAAIETMRHRLSERFCATSLRFGWSDHSVKPEVILRAAHRWSAETIEFHLDLEGLGSEYQSGHCWLPNQIAPVIKTCHEGLKADGDGIKKPNRTEIDECDWRADPYDGLRPFMKIRKVWEKK